MNLQLAVPLNQELSEGETRTVSSFLVNADKVCFSHDKEFIYIFEPKEIEEESEEEKEEIE